MSLWDKLTGSGLNTAIGQQNIQGNLNANREDYNYAQQVNSYNQNWNPFNQGLTSGSTAGSAISSSRMQPRTAAQVQAEIQQQEAALNASREELKRIFVTTPIKGPTPEEIEQYPALKSLVEELRTTMKLVGINR